MNGPVGSMHWGRRFQILSRTGIVLLGIVFGARSQESTSHILSATDGPRVERKTIEGLPSKSIAVGYPARVHFAFNPVSSSIVAAWKGDFLDVGASWSGDDGNPNRIGGEWIFRDEGGIRLLVDGEVAELKFTKYSVGNDAPIFECANGRDRVEIFAFPETSGGLRFHYRISGFENRRISLRLPYSLKAESEDGTILAGQLLVDTEKRSAFSLTVLKEQMR